MASLGPCGGEPAKRRRTECQQLDQHEGAITDLPDADIGRSRRQRIWCWTRVVSKRHEKEEGVAIAAAPSSLAEEAKATARDRAGSSACWRRGGSGMVRKGGWRTRPTTRRGTRIPHAIRLRRSRRDQLLDRDEAAITRRPPRGARADPPSRAVHSPARRCGAAGTRKTMVPVRRVHDDEEGGGESTPRRPKYKAAGPGAETRNNASIVFLMPAWSASHQDRERSPQMHDRLVRGRSGSGQAGAVERRPLLK